MGRKLEVRGQGSEVRCQRSEVSNWSWFHAHFSIFIFQSSMPMPVTLLKMGWEMAWKTDSEKDF